PSCPPSRRQGHSVLGRPPQRCACLKPHAAARYEKAMTMSRHALIIGGSLGGLFAAHCLRAAGWQVDVFERSAEDLAGRGAGLGTHDALVAVMRRIGIDPETPPLGVATPAYLWVDSAGGVIRDVPLPRVMTAWARLYRPLKDGFPAEHYHSAKSLARVEQGERVTAIFADGTRASGDLLVAA